MFKISGQKAEVFASFDGGTGEYDAANFVVEQSGDGFSHGEVGFAGSGGTDAEGDAGALECVDIALLAEGAGKVVGFTWAYGDADAGELAEGVVFSFEHCLITVLDGLGVDGSLLAGFAEVVDEGS